MKKINFLYLSLIGMVMLFSCNEESDDRGLVKPDSTIPGTVSNPVVTNLAGGAKIEYKIPDDQDALYVQASYSLASGRVVTTKSSIFKNSVIIEGLREADVSKEVTLEVVDRSGNISPPVSVSISPTKAPIDILFESLELYPDFGGIRVVYDNSEEIRAEIELFVFNENGVPLYNQSLFIENATEIFHVYRTFPPDSIRVGVSIVDRWDNSTDMIEGHFAPFAEEKLDITKFDNVVLNGDEVDAYGWVMTNLWNANINGNGFHTGQGNPGGLIAPYTEAHHMFTMDIGLVSKLSRVIFWQRQGTWSFWHGNPRYFEIWGIDELPDNSGSFDGWTRLIENGEVIKPSGEDLGLRSRSAEDEASAATGEEFIFAIDAPEVRYIRFVNIENWVGTKFMHLTEIEFWGSVEESE